MTLRWSAEVGPQLEAIHAYIAENSPIAADASIKNVLRAAERLVTGPHLGKPGRRKGTRELIHPPFVIVYRQIEDVINIESVFHGNQRF